MCSLFSVDNGGFSRHSPGVLTLPSTGWQVGAMAGSALVGTAWQQRDFAQWAEGCKSTGENTGKSCWLLWAGPGNESCFCFLPPAARPAGACWVQGGGKGSCCGSWGIDWEEDSMFLSLCKSNDPRDLALGEVKRCRFEPGWCGTSAAPRAAQRHWCAVATTLLPLCPFCVPVSPHWQHAASRVVSSSFQPALFGQLGS